MPILNNVNIPLISSFRYWGRASLLLTFSCAYLAAFGVEELGKLKLQIKNLIYLAPAGIIYLGITLANLNNIETTKTLSFMLHGGIAKDYVLYAYLGITAIVLAVSIFAIIKKTNSSTIKLILAIVICLDLFVPATQLTKSYYVTKQNFEQNIKLGLDKYKNERIIFLDDKKIFGNTMMYQQSWGMFGYSAPLESTNYISYINSLGFDSVRRPKLDTSPELWNQSQIYNLSHAGITTIIKKDGKVFPLRDTNVLDILQNTSPDVSAQYLTKEEGNVTLAINTKGIRQIQTSIRNYQGWQLYINGVRQNFISKPTDLFLKFEVQTGNSVVELKYIPVGFYKGLYYSLCLLIVSAISYLIYRDKIRTNA